MIIGLPGMTLKMIIQPGLAVNVLRSQAQQDNEPIKIFLDSGANILASAAVKIGMYSHKPLSVH